MQLFDDLEDFGSFDDVVSGDVRDPYTELARLRKAGKDIVNLLEGDPVLLGEISGLLVTLLPARTDVLAGPELGGIPLVTICSGIARLPARLIRRQAPPNGTPMLDG